MWCLAAATLIGILPAPDAAAGGEAAEARCLLVISINPESRVKVERGPAAATLRRGIPALVVVKVQNDAGLTAPLSVSGQGIGADGWLDVRFVASSRLRGNRVQYLVLRLTARESGKREATFRCDAGQGTQDLGFRAEVPVLFNVQ